MLLYWYKLSPDLFKISSDSFQIYWCFEYNNLVKPDSYEFTIKSIVI